MRIRIVTFGLDVPAEDYLDLATGVAPAFTSWPGLLAKWWLGDAGTGTYGGVYLFASREDADRSRDTDLFRGMCADPALREVTVREYDVLDGPTAVTAPARAVGGLPQGSGAASGREGRADRAGRDAGVR
ncbi:YdhR family protein [Geodermatophilus sp. YIM 151500]|uniref:YdhR family protein n=1 Tax=Geodermatophilus sp. YIM 151500 TaxID=2984531 RepID=UPI0021E39CEE|nr:YdhR family protein [Geodermatophilus sp. YIM 151500]MCV2489318.1 YdhR family protein [Geodermatophilus sp. YIM 151500]